jgi:2-polyprenyl-6-methoxyphenol hydroxylase-like FAD-dependent oxidoreductase
VTQPRNILIVGAGIGGLSAAVALAQAGFEVDVVEIEEASRAPGVGFGLRTNGMRAIREIGLLDAAVGIGTVGAGLNYYDNEGNHLCDLYYEDGEEGMPSNLNLPRLGFVEVATARAKELGCTFRMSTTVSTLDQDPDGVDIVFSDGATARYDLVIGYDGVNSQIRDEYFGTRYRPTPAGGVAWRIQLPRAKGLESTMFCQGYGGKFVFAPLPDDLMYIVLTVAENGRPRYDPAEMPQIMYERARALMGDSTFMAESIELIRAAESVTYSPYSTVWVPYPWFRGRVMIMGDAAHAMVPYLGSGAAMGIEDGVVIAQELQRDQSIVESQIRFMARRLPRVRAVRDRSMESMEQEFDTLTEDALQRRYAWLRHDEPIANEYSNRLLGQPY